MDDNMDDKMEDIILGKSEDKMPGKTEGRMESKLDNKLEGRIGGKLPGMDKERQLELYIHVPFCIKKCDYCDFLSAPSEDAVKKKYFEALKKEIKSYEGRTADYRVSTIFIGGGTPSCVEAGYLKEILTAVREVFQFTAVGVPEISIEINPGTINQEKLRIYQEAGINRISFGLQSTLDHELRLLGRIHDYKRFEKNYALARSMDFKNINVDLMSALPGQTLKDWETSLRRVAELGPEHISAYSLIIEEGTPFYETYGAGRPGAKELPEEETDRLMYKRTAELLREYGYHRYEISNYSLKGYECRHNLGYWTGIEYLGLGLGASSLLGNTRFHNTDNLMEYINACTDLCKNEDNPPLIRNIAEQSCLLNNTLGIRRELINLSKAMQMEEFMFLGLRAMEGVSRDYFNKRFGQDMDEIYGSVINTLKTQGLLQESGGAISLTGYGIDVSNRVLAEFLLD